MAVTAVKLGKYRGLGRSVGRSRMNLHIAIYIRGMSVVSISAALAAEGVIILARRDAEYVRHIEPEH